MYDLGGPFADRTVEPGTNILLAGPPLIGKAAMGYELLASGISDGEGAVVVSNADGAERIRTEHSSLFERSGPVGIVDCITNNRRSDALGDADLVRYVSSPEDMTGIGIEFSELLEEFYTERGSTRNRALFDSISTILMYSNLQTVFRFLHVFTTRIENADALGLFVIQSDGHDDKTMNTLSQLFDGIVRVDEDGDATAQFP